MWWGIMLLITRGDSFFFPFWVLNSDGGEKWEQKKKNQNQNMPTWFG